MSYTKNLATPEQLVYRTAFDDGWAAHESYVEQMILSQDPGYLAWLDKMERLAHVQRERDELNLQQQMAAQADDDMHP